MTYSISSVNGKNTVSAAKAYRRTAESAEAWVLLGNVSGTAVKYSGLSASVEYEIEFDLKDYFTEITEIQNLSGKTIDDIYPGGTGYAIGGYAEDGKFISHMPAQMKDDLDVVGNLTVGGNALKACTALGTDASVSLIQNTITKIPLTTLNPNMDSSIFSISDGGIKVLKAGNYLIGGSAYIQLGAPANTAMGRGIYIYQNAVEIMNSHDWSYNAGSTGTVCSTMKVVAINANDIIYLKGRTQNTTGTAYPNNLGTYLTIIKI